MSELTGDRTVAEALALCVGAEPRMQSPARCGFRANTPFEQGDTLKR